MPYPLARPDPFNRRFSQRVSSRARGVVRTAAGDVPCVIRDRSSGGLRLVFETATHLEPVFQILDNETKRERTVMLVWTDARQAGVAFRD